MKFLASRRRYGLVTLAAAVLGMPLVSAAQATFPIRPISIVVPFTAGGGSDIVTRVVAQKLSDVLGTAVVIDNRAGAGGTIGSAYVARAPADGYTLISLTTSTHAIAPAIYSKLPYDPVADFEPVGLIGTSPYVLTLPATAKATDFKSFLADAKSTGTQVNFASAGAGTLAHLIGEQFCKQFAVSCIHVPYQGESASFTDLINGSVAFSFFNPIGVVQHVKSGKLKALAQTGKSTMLPNVPTFAELGLNNFNHDLWMGLAAPKGTPPAVVQKLNAALSKVLNNPLVIAELDSKGFIARSSTDAAFKDQIAEQRKYWSQVANQAGVKIQ